MQPIKAFQKMHLLGSSHIYVPLPQLVVFCLEDCVNGVQKLPYVKHVSLVVQSRRACIHFSSPISLLLLSRFFLDSRMVALLPLCVLSPRKLLASVKWPRDLVFCCFVNRTQTSLVHRCRVS